MANHIIKQQKIEIETASNSNAQEIFTEISRLFNHRVKDAMGYSLDAIADDQQLLKVDSLELNLGTIQFPFSEEDFVDKYIKALESAISAFLQESKAHSTSAEEPAKSSDHTLADILHHYLLTGTITWWANSNDLKNPETVFNILLDKDKQSLENLIQLVLPQAIARKRIAYAFHETIVTAVIQITQPSDAGYITNYHKEVTEIHVATNFVQTENSAFRKALWLFILDFLADNNGSRFNRKMFVKSTISSIASNFNISFEQILYYLSEGAKIIPQHFKQTENLVSLIDEIAFESEQTIPLQTSSLNRSTNNNQQPANSSIAHPFLYYLLNGFLPHLVLGVNDNNREEIFILELQRDFAITRSFFQKHGSIPVVRKRLIENFTETAVQEVVKVVEPANAETIIAYATYTNTFQKKTSLIKAEENVFKRSLWELILSFLFSELGSVFNAKMFLVRNISALARHYNIDYRRLLAILVQGVGQHISTASHQSGLFYLLTEILTESKNQNIGDEYAEETQLQNLNLQETERKKKAQKKSVIEELWEENQQLTKTSKETFAIQLFLYLLENGTLPWWAAQKIAPVETIINEILAAYKTQLQPIILLVAQKNSISPIFLAKYATVFNAAVIENWDASKEYQQLRSFTEAWQRLNNISISAEILFAKTFFAALRTSSSFTVSVPLFAQHLFNTIQEANTGIAFDLKFPESVTTGAEILATLKAEFNRVYKSANAARLTRKSNYSDTNFLVFVQFLAARSNYTTADQILKDLPEVVLQFIVNGQQLPAYFKTEVLLPQEFIAWVLEFLFRTNKAALKLIFDHPSLALEKKVLAKEYLENASFYSGAKTYIEQQITKQLLTEIGENTSAPDTEKWKAVVAKLLAAEFSKEEQETWLTLLKIEGVRIALAIHMKDATIEAFAHKIARPQLFEAYQLFVEGFVTTTTDHFEKTQFKKWIIEFFLLLAGYQQSQYSTEILAKQFATFLLNKTTVLTEKLATHLQKIKTNGISFEKPETASLVKLVHNEILAENTLITARDEILAKLIKTEKQLERLDRESDLNEYPEQNKKALTDQNADTEKQPYALPFGEHIYIQNAGMILMHPFLPTLFLRSGLIQNSEFISADALAMAAKLLQFATTGTESCEEHELVLNKILVGVAPEEFIDVTISLSQENLTLTNEMLKAIMAQWDKMKNTSLEGFRNSFLIRDGYIFETDEAWVLRVEQRAYDLLLQTLPWSLSMVKYSWMKKPINIEWT